MKKYWYKIKHWYWWKFKATEEEKTKYQMLTFGTGFMKDGKFVDIREIYKKSL